MNATLTLADGSTYSCNSFGYIQSVAGEVVFTTGMVGYTESMTDPSYKGQILVFTYPMIGNYGVPDKKYWESDKIHTTAIIVSSYINNDSHHQSKQTLSQWLLREKIPGLEIRDTRALTQKIRESGALLGKIEFGNTINYYDPNRDNLVKKVSISTVMKYGYDNVKAGFKSTSSRAQKHIALIDCGVKRNIIRSLVKRNTKVTVVPWDFDVTTLKEKPNGVVLSNGPGDPKMLTQTIANVKKILKLSIPILGICLGNQILTLASGGNTRKMKFGHRSQNQPCLCYDNLTKYYLTTQNHGFEVSQIPKGYKQWFTNANDGTNEGIIHESKPWMSVQFHPEATPGPTDTYWVFDYFLSHITHNT